MARDWMPHTRAAQMSMANRWNDVFVEKAADWGIPQTMVNRLRLLTADASDAQARLGQWSEYKSAIIP